MHWVKIETPSPSLSLATWKHMCRPNVVSYVFFCAYTSFWLNNHTYLYFITSGEVNLKTECNVCVRSQMLIPFNKDKLTFGGSAIRDQSFLSWIFFKCLCLGPYSSVKKMFHLLSIKSLWCNLVLIIMVHFVCSLRWRSTLHRRNVFNFELKWYIFFLKNRR